MTRIDYFRATNSDLTERNASETYFKGWKDPINVIYSFTRNGMFTVICKDG